MFQGIMLLAFLSRNQQFCKATDEIASYTFRYSINNHQIITQHWEQRKSDIVLGSYSFLGSDGKVRIVEYQVNGSSGFRAVVTYRNPPGSPLLGPLKYPSYYKHPIILVQPVSFITEDLLKIKKISPYLPE